MAALQRPATSRYLTVAYPCPFPLSRARRKDFDQLGFGFVAAESEVEFLVAIKADYVGEEANLRFGPVTVRAVDLAVDTTGVDE